MSQKSAILMLKSRLHQIRWHIIQSQSTAARVVSAAAVAVATVAVAIAPPSPLLPPPLP
jgi:hypothetical protein